MQSGRCPVRAMLQTRPRLGDFCRTACPGSIRGREMVPVLYTWPAGMGGTFGYAYDRESGEFTIFHLKQFLRSLAEFTDIEKIHILAHSRGTDVVLTALRELFIEARGLGNNPRSFFRIANLILAAPDLDGEVFSQRMIAERIGFGINQITIYSSANDKAIELSEILFNSAARLGRIVSGADGITNNVSMLMEQQVAFINNVSFIEIQGKSNFFGHDYFHSNPAVASDLIMILRHGAAQGKQSGRPLKPLGNKRWILSNDLYGKN